MSTKIVHFSSALYKTVFQIFFQKFKKKTKITSNIFDNRKVDMQYTKIIIIPQLISYKCYTFKYPNKTISMNLNLKRNLAEL